MGAEPDQADIELMGRQAAKSKATREKLVSAVIEIIHEKGFQAASSSRIARKAGVTWGAVQHHFGSKEDILEEVLAQSHRQFHETLSASRFLTGDAQRRVSRYVDAAWSHYQGKIYMAALEILLASREREHSVNEVVIRRSRSEHLKLGRRIFHDSKASDKTMQEVIYLVHCMLTGVLVESVLERRNFNGNVYLRHLKNLIGQMLYPGAHKC